MKCCSIEFYCNGKWEKLIQLRPMMPAYFENEKLAEKFITKTIKEKIMPANEPYYQDKRVYRIITEFPIK